MFDSYLTEIRKKAKESVAGATFKEIFNDAVDSDISNLQAGARFLAVQTDWAEPTQMSMGRSPRWQHEGALQMVFFEPEGKGDGLQLDMMATAEKFLRNATINQQPQFYVRFFGPSTENGIKEGPHHVRILRTPLRVTFYPNHV